VLGCAPSKGRPELERGRAAFSVTLRLLQSELLEGLRELLAPVLKIIQRRHA
jgi:hypothetical protein